MMTISAPRQLPFQGWTAAGRTRDQSPLAPPPQPERPRAGDERRARQDRHSCSRLDREPQVRLPHVPPESPEAVLDLPDEGEFGRGDLVRSEGSIDDLGERVLRLAPLRKSRCERTSAEHDPHVGGRTEHLIHSRDALRQRSPLPASRPPSPSLHQPRQHSPLPSPLGHQSFDLLLRTPNLHKRLDEARKLLDPLLEIEAAASISSTSRRREGERTSSRS